MQKIFPLLIILLSTGTPSFALDQSEEGPPQTSIEDMQNEIDILGAFFEEEETEEEEIAVDGNETSLDKSKNAEESDLLSLDRINALISEEPIVEEAETDDPIDLAGQLLEDEGISWNGNFSGKISYGLDWDDYWNTAIFRGPDNDSLSPSVSANLRFNARPDENFRIGGKLAFTADAGFSFGSLDINPSDFALTTDENGNLVISNVNAGTREEDPGAETEEEEETIPDQVQTTIGLAVEELFSDFNWDRNLFFRFGKSFIKWGKGYFWSPADIVNLGRIDSEDPTAERQGPLNLKINYPFDNHNLYLYMLLDGVTVPEHLGIAASAEFLVGDFELGAGGFYKYTQAPRAVGVFSGSLGDIGLFGEASVSFGSDKVFVRESRIQPEFEEPEEGEGPPQTYVALDTYEIDGLPFFSGTIGGMYMNNDINLNVIVQYYFNGEGYTDKRFPDGTSLLDNAAYLYQNPDTNGLALPADSQGDNYREPPALDTDDLMNFGQHYLGVSLSFNKLFDSDLNFSIFWLGNLTDWSGIISPALSYKLFDRATADLSARMTYGQSGDEYTSPQALFEQDKENSPQVPTFNLSLSFSLGGGSF